jgi:precorrin-2 dehydrogenase/sirohydrochlorin ferrochelatase
MLDSMGYIPLFFDVTGRRCIVLGGDELAERRSCTLLEAGAIVTVISAALTSRLAELAIAGRIRHLPRSFAPGDLRGAALVYCYAEDLAIARAAVDEARALGVPINVCDRPALCTFIAPAVVKRGALQIAISTGGTSPALAKILRQELEASLGGEYTMLLEILAATRQLLRERAPGLAKRAELANALARELRAALTVGDYAALEEILRRNLGVTLADLGIDRTATEPAPIPNPPQVGPQ